jgi:hypothetical protein
MITSSPSQMSAVPHRLVSEPLNIAHRFDALTALLRPHRPHWEPRPFAYLRAPWERTLPEVAQWLRGLTDEAIDGLEANPSFTEDAPTMLRELAASIAALTQIPALEGTPIASLRSRKGWRHVPGRKQAQIRAFTEVIVPLLPTDTPLVDWCAGKGHLGRILGRVTGRPVTCIEHQGPLCDAGARIAAADGVHCDFMTGDVLNPQATTPLDTNAVMLGLHACGQLTDRLLEHVVTQKLEHVAFASCCYHRLGDLPGHVPQSRAGQLANLPLNRGHLRLPTADEVVAAPGPRALRRRELAWRLGFDLLLREATGENIYRPLGRIARTMIELPFGQFCLKLARERQLPLPPRWDADTAEKHAHERCRQTRGLGLLRGLYRRPMELWLVLDRALLLQEHGRKVTVGTFCPAAASPRNLLVHTLKES